MYPCPASALIGRSLMVSTAPLITMPPIWTPPTVEPVGNDRPPSAAATRDTDPPDEVFVNLMESPVIIVVGFVVSVEELILTYSIFFFTTSSSTDEDESKKTQY